MRAGLVGDDVGPHPALHQFGEDFGGVAQQADRLRLARGGPALDQGERFVQAFGLLVEIARAQAEIDALGIAFDRQAAGPGHRRGKRLRPAHAAKPAGQDPFARQIAPIMLPARLDEGLVGALDDALRADVDPRTGRHLAVHHQALPIELAEMVPVRPVRHDVRIRDQHARGIGMRAEHAHGLARLHQQRLIVRQGLEARQDRFEIAPAARRAADTAIDHQLVRVFRHLAVEIVLDHAERRFGLPAAAGEFGAGRRLDVAGVAAVDTHARSPNVLWMPPNTAASVSRRLAALSGE